MDLRTQLATRFHIENIRELLHYIKEDERLREEIYRLIFDEDDVVSYQALWVCKHFSKVSGYVNFVGIVKVYYGLVLRMVD